MRSSVRYICYKNNVYLLQSCSCESYICRRSDLRAVILKKLIHKGLDSIYHNQFAVVYNSASDCERNQYFASNVAIVIDLSCFVFGRYRYRFSARISVIITDIFLWLYSVPPGKYWDSTYSTRRDDPFLLHYFSFIIFNIYYHLRLGLPSGFFPSAFPNNIFIHYYLSPT
jgi:hypothetical protein